MHKGDADTVFPVQVFSQMLGRIDAAMLAACASEREHQVGETALDISFHMMISQAINALKESEYLSVVLKETNHRLIQARQLLVLFVTAGVVGTAAIEYIAAAVAALVCWNPTLKGEGEYADVKAPIYLTPGGVK